MEDDRIVISSGPTLTPESVASRTFATGFRGYDQDQVRAFLKRVADELSMVAAREGELRESMQEALHRAAHPQLDVEALTTALGEHAARLLTNAREAAANIVAEAETRAARIMGEAESKIARVRAEADSLLARRSEEAERLTAGLRSAVEADVRAQRERARAEAESEVESARAQGREMIAEARALRERMLTDLARRRRAAEVQIEQLRLARQRLLEAYGVVRRTVDEATTELAAAEAEAQPALIAASGRVSPPPEVQADDDPLRPSASGATRTTDAGSAVSSDTPAKPRSGPGAGGGPSTNGGSGTADQRETARSGSAPAPAGPAGAQPARVATGSTSSVPGLASGPVSGPGQDNPAASAVAAAVSAARSLVSVAPPAEAAGPALHQPPRSDGADRSGSASAGALSAVPSPENDAPPEAPEAATGEAGSVLQVDELFARMRAAQSSAAAARTREADGEPPAAPSAAGSPARPDDAPSAEAEPPDGPTGATGRAGRAALTTAVTDESILSRRDEVLEPLCGDLVRQLKRVLQDEHNEVLDRLRQQRRAAADAVLPDAAAQRERFAAAARPLLAEAARLGAASAPGDGDEQPVPAREVDQWAAELAGDLVGPLRDRLEQALRDASSSTGEDDDDPAPVRQERPGGPVADRLSAGYRQWKSQQTEPVARHHAVRAYSGGAFMAMPEGQNLRWLLDDDGPCPDCDDNVLAGAQLKGQPFPTGQVHPPAHMGCRCLLAVAAP